MLPYEPEAAAKHLRRVDPVLAGVMDLVGPFTLTPVDGAFRSLARAIFFQQLAGPAARAILNRALAALDSNEQRFFTPGQLLAAPEEALRAAGVSAQKLRYLRDLAEKFDSGELREEEFSRLTDEEVIQMVTTVKGIGRWTAEMFLIFSLGRPDVLPIDDLGLRRGIQRSYSLPDIPAPAQVTDIGEPWRPYRSVGTWYMWRSLGIELPDSPDG